MFSSFIKYGVTRKITQRSTLTVEMRIGIPHGVLLRIQVDRASQTYNFPVHLSDEIIVQPILYGTVTPLIIWYAYKKLILDPWEAKKLAKEKEIQREKEKSR